MRFEGPLPIPSGTLHETEKTAATEEQLKIQTPETPKQIEIPRVNKELFDLENDPEKFRSFYEKLKIVSPDEKIYIYHGIRSGPEGMVSILKSDEKGIKGGSVGGAPTYSVFPVSSYWNQADSLGLRYSFDRKTVKFPGEEETLDTLIQIDDKGLVYIKEGLTHLSLVDFKGEVAMGPNSRILEADLNKIRQELLKIRELKERLRPITESASLDVKKEIAGLIENGQKPASLPSFIERQIKSLLPVTVEDLRSDAYESKINQLEQQASKIATTENDPVLEGDAKFISELRKQLNQSKKTLEKIYSRTNESWTDESSTSQFLKEDLPPHIKLFSSEVLSGKIKGAELKKELVADLKQLILAEEKQLAEEEGEVSNKNQEAEACRRVVDKTKKIRELINSYKIRLEQALIVIEKTKKITKE